MKTLAVTGLRFSCLQIASQLRLFDPQLRERPEEESFVEPAWLVQLQRVERQVKVSVAQSRLALRGRLVSTWVLGTDRTAGRRAGCGRASRSAVSSRWGVGGGG